MNNIYPDFNLENWMDWLYNRDGTEYFWFPLGWWDYYKEVELN